MLRESNRLPVAGLLFLNEESKTLQGYHLTFRPKRDKKFTG